MDWSKFEMEPKEFKRLTGYPNRVLAEICDRDEAHVAKWFCKGSSKRPCTSIHKRMLYAAYELGYGEKINEYY